MNEYRAKKGRGGWGEGVREPVLTYFSLDIRYSSAQSVPRCLSHYMNNGNSLPQNCCAQHLASATSQRSNDSRVPINCRRAAQLFPRERTNKNILFTATWLRRHQSGRATRRHVGTLLSMRSFLSSSKTLQDVDIRPALYVLILGLLQVDYMF